jgi:heteromeric Ino2p/Ino4p transcription factor
MANSSTPPASAKAAEKPRLTDQEKKNNHIASEQKRREAIRAGFDKLADIVPGMEGQGRSEATVLQATVSYTREQIDERRRLLEAAKARGLNVAEYELEENGGDDPS